MDSLRGRLLIAGPSLFDPNFRRTILLVAEHDEEGALGVVLNRPAPITVAEAVPVLADFASRDEPVFLGGPVQPGSVVVLADFEQPDRAGLLVTDSIGFLVGEVDADVASVVRRARVFSGYAGWGPGQLEAELADDSWIVEPAAEADLFTDDPEGLWGAILRRKGGDFALMATMPFDPSMN